MSQDTYFIELAGKPVPIVIKKLKNSRRFTLRYLARGPHVALNIPRYGSIKQALAFAKSKRGWLELQATHATAQIPFANGVELPLFGLPVTISHQAGRGVVELAGDRLIVPGTEAFLARRVKDFIRKSAQKKLAELAREHAARLGMRVQQVTVRDTTSRWGSCSTGGRLSFSWRLAFAPLEIMDYLVCHEVAHLKEHNHSDRFWRLVAELYPDWKKAERWLKNHGPELHRYG